MSDDQDKLADEWAAALQEAGDDIEAEDTAEDGTSKKNKSPEDALADEWAAALQESGGEIEAEDATEDGADKKSKSPEDALADEWAAALAESEQEDMTEEKEKSFMETKLKDANFADMTDIAKTSGPDSNKRDMDFILDIPLDVSAELGRTKLLINELLQLGQGSVVELNKLAGEPLEVYVNGKLVARGEAVVINEKFGIRLTDIISPIERVKQLA